MVGLLLFAQTQPELWNFERLAQSIFHVILYAIIGMALAFGGFKVFDMLTPGKLEEEILQKQNIAAAILVGAFMVGVCIIIAASIHG